MFFLPTRQRPAELQQTLDACVVSGMTAPAMALIDPDGAEAYADIRWPANWAHTLSAPGQTPAAALQDAFVAHPGLDWYGMLSDACLPATPGWDLALIGALGRTKIISANDGWRANADPIAGRLPPVTVFGGDLLRAVGWWFPADLQTYCIDEVWETIGRDFALLAIQMETLAPHRLAAFRSAIPGIPYDLFGEADDLVKARDIAAFRAWLGSTDRYGINERLAGLLGGSVMQFDPKSVNLAILIPCHDRPEQAFNMSLRESETMLKQWGLPYGIHWTNGGSNIGKARERVLWNAFHHETKHTHFLFIDADMGWQPHLIMRLIAAGHEVCAAVGVKKDDKGEPACNFLPGALEFSTRSGFCKIRDVGGAFLLIARTAIDKMCATYPELEYDVGASPNREWALFVEMLDKVPGQRLPERLSEDFSFCRRWRAIGGEIFIDHDTALDHVGKKTYTGKPSDFFQKLPSGAQQAAE